jgi:branched-chain amino acid transport system substrate-binding protein
LKQQILAAAMTVCAAFCAGCGEKKAAREKLQLGMILPSTGASSATGTRQIDGAGLAVEEINAGPGLLGGKYDIELVYRDDTSVAAKGIELATELKNLNLPAILGSGPSSITLGISDITVAAKMVQIAGSSTSPAISTKADDGYLFRTSPSDALQGKLLAKRAKDRGHTSVSIIHSPGAYGTGLAAAFKASFEAGGGTVLINHEFTEKQSESDYNTMLSNTVYAAGDPQAILLVGVVVDAANIMRAYVNNHIANGDFWYFSDSVSVSDFVAGVGASNFTFPHEGTKPGPPMNARFAAFQNAFNNKYGKMPETFSANAYDAMYLLALAIEAAGVEPVTGTAIRDNMTAVSKDGTAYSPSDLTAMFAAAKAKDDINYEGASGNVDFDANGDVFGAYDIWNVQSGAITVTEAAIAAPQ